MAQLRLKLLGPPIICLDDKELTGFHSNKVRALLFYLSVTQQQQARSTLAGLFWPDYPDSRAMANLRKALSNLRKLVGDHVSIERERVAFDIGSDYWLDMEEFLTGISHLQNWGDYNAVQQAVDLYEGEFLQGFYLRDTTEWEHWTLTERIQLSSHYQDALMALVRHFGDTAKYDDGIVCAQKLVTVEPLREDIHRLLMVLYSKNGQRSQALHQYETCREILQEELGVNPADDTHDLYEKIISGNLEADFSFGSQLPAEERMHRRSNHNLTAASTP